MVYDRSNYVNYHRTSGDGVSLHESSPNEDEFNLLRDKFANDIIGLEDSIIQLVKANLFLTKKGIPAKNRRRIILEPSYVFHLSVIDQYDHDLQFIVPYVKLDMVEDKVGVLKIHEMQVN